MSSIRRAIGRIIFGVSLLSGSVALGDEAPASPPHRRGKVSLPGMAAQVEAVSSQLKNADDNLRVVETQYTQRAEVTDEEALLRRFSDGEIQYLLGDYPGASVLIYDIISDPRFKAGSKYPDALFYLADSLYQQQNFIGAQLYLRELLARGPSAPHYKEALSRYLETASRLNEFTGIDDYVQQARQLPGGLSPDLSYAIGKWTFRRTDLDTATRLARAEQIFAALAGDAESPFHLQAAYFLGVIEVQRAQGTDYSAAVEAFRRITQAEVKSPRDAKVKEMAHLSLGRLLYESGKYDEALDQYQEIPRESENFVDSLYEIAWVHVKKGEWELAKNATEIITDIVAPDAPIAPEAKILQGHLLLKLHRYEAASDTYNVVINKYAPVRDEMDALLTVNKDPVTYFDNLLARNDKNLDVAALLPPVALKYASTQKEVADAVRIVNDLESGRHGVTESQEIAQRILKALDDRGLEAFPALQEGYTRAEGVDTALTNADQGLLIIEGHLVEDQLTPEELAEYSQLKAQLEEYQKRFATLPTTPAEVEARKKRMQERVDEIDKEAFKLGYEVQSLQAIKVAVEKWLDETRGQRHSTVEEEKAFMEQLRQESQALAGHQQELDELRQALAVERASADAVLSGEEALREEYVQLLRKQHQLISAAESRLGEEGAKVLKRAHEVRQQLTALRERVAAAKAVLKEQVARRGKQIRDKVAAEQALLAGYGSDVQAVSGDARGLVGRIAFDSFKRVRQQFYELVLKADVGIVDVAFTRKQDKTAEIQRVSAQKDRELRALDEEFKEVLKDVD